MSAYSTLTPSCRHGKRYTDEARAVRENPGAEVFSCGTCPGWHARTARPWLAASARLHAVTPSRVTLRAVTPAKGRKDTIPPEVRALVSLRDRWCVRCGDPRGLQIHHRRLKQAGPSDGRPHTECTCNTARFCLLCHVPEIHCGDRERNEAEGYIVPADVEFPGSVSLLVATADGGLTRWPDCAGGWADGPGGGLAA